MQILRSLDGDDISMVGRAVRVMMLGSGPEGAAVSRRLATMGARVDVVDELFAGLSELMDDPAGHALFVVDCDEAGGMETAGKALRMLNGLSRRIEVILMSSECRTQSFPQEPGEAVVLRKPVSAVSLKVGYEHALRERFPVLVG